MNRAEFATVLQRLSSALSAKDLVPVFSCYCFDGQRVHTYDDIVALEAPFAFPVPGAYRGDLLLKWANSVQAEEVAIEAITEADVTLVQFKCGRSNIKLPQISADNFIFGRPSKKGSIELKVTEEFVAAIASVLPCVSRDATHPWQFGVTIKPGQKKAVVLATNNLSAARATIPAIEGMSEAILLPPRFCDLLVEMGKQGITNFILHEDSAVSATFDNGVRLFSKIGSGVDASRYDQLFTPERLSEIKEKLKDCPPGLQATIQRASLVLDKGEAHTLNFKFKEDRLVIQGLSGQGDVKEALKFPDHEACSGDFDPDYLNPVLGSAEMMCMLPQLCLAFWGQGTMYLFKLLGD